MKAKKEWKPTRVTGVRKIDRSVAKYNFGIGKQLN